MTGIIAIITGAIVGIACVAAGVLNVRGERQDSAKQREHERELARG